MTTAHTTAGELQPGMTAKVRPFGKKNRVTIEVTNKILGPGHNQVRLWGDNPNAPYGRSSKVALRCAADQEVEVIEEA